MKPSLLLLLLLGLLNSCSNSSDPSARSSSSPPLGESALGYASYLHEMLIGVPQEIRPRDMEISLTADYQCEISPELPAGLSISKHGVISGVPLKSCPDTLYTVSMTKNGVRQEATLSIFVPQLQESMFPPAPIPLRHSKYYKVVPLDHDEQFLVAFDAQGVSFINGENPFDLDEISYIGVLSYGMPQAITSLGEYVYLTTLNGRLLTFDWSDREAPVLSTVFELHSANQYYDIAHNNQDTLFIANTQSQHLAIVKLASSTEAIIQQVIALDGMASGVAYHNNRVYVANYSTGHIHVYRYHSELEKWQEMDPVKSLSHPARLSIGADYLAAHRYNSNQFQLFSLNGADNQLKALETVTTKQTIGVYSRSIFKDDYLMVAQSSSFSFYHIDPRGRMIKFFQMPLINPEIDESYQGIMGFHFYRHQSSLAYIGRTANGNIRHLNVISDYHDIIDSALENFNKRITMIASRDYAPSSWDSHYYTVENTGTYFVPEMIEVNFGNSGTGWASLSTADRKFCFQGNASNNNARNGRQFVLKHEKSDLYEECYEKHSNITADQKLILRQGEQIKLSIDGGGCSSQNPRSCMETEGEIILLYQTQE